MQGMGVSEIRIKMCSKCEKGKVMKRKNTPPPDRVLRYHLHLQQVSNVSSCHKRSKVEKSEKRECFLHEWNAQ